MATPPGGAAFAAAPSQADVDRMVRLAMFHEDPSKAAATAALVLYAAATVAVTAAAVRARAWFLLTVSATGALLVLGFVMRIVLLTRTPTLMIFIQVRARGGTAAWTRARPALGRCSSLSQGCPGLPGTPTRPNQPTRQMEAFLIIPPVLLAIVDYICTGRLLAAAAAADADADADAPHDTTAGGAGRASAPSPRQRQSGARWVARLFTASDLLCLALQGAGGALCAAPSTMQTGTRLLLVGLSLQLGFFTLYTAITVRVHRTKFARDAAARPLFACLYATIALMYLRNVFRVVEFGTGYTGYLKTHEAFFYCLDCVPLWICFAVFTAMPRYIRSALSARALPTAGAGGKQRGGQGGGAVPAGSELVVVRCGDA
jgi:hypothetical protein